MASKKRQKVQVASQVPVRTSNEDKRQKTASFEDEEEEKQEEDEDALEMERNFALFSKRGSVQTTERIEKDTSGVESEDDDDEDKEEEEEDDDDEEVEEEDEEDDDDDDEEEDDDDLLKERTEQRDCKETDSSSILQLKPDLSTMSFEEVIMLQSKIGTKSCKKLINASQEKRQKSEAAKHVTRNGPQEISAKKPVSFLRKVCTVKRPTLRDPRFDDLSGEFKPEVFGQTYKFIDDIRQREVKMVKKQLKKVKSTAKKEELKSFLKRMENQKRNRERQEQQREKELSYKRKQRALVGDGHRPFYLKKSDKKKLQLAEKYSELKKSGKLENFLSKKRKRNAVKDRRKMP